MNDILRPALDADDFRKAATRCPHCNDLAANFVCTYCKRPKPNAPSWLKAIAEAEAKL